MDQKQKRPGTACDSTGPKSKNSNETISHLTREILSTLLAAAIFAASVWSSVFGMAADLASGPITPIGYSVAEVNQDGR